MNRTTTRSPWLSGIAAATAVAAVSLTLTACGSSGSGSGTTITLYNAQHEQTTSALIAAFTKQTGIKVKVDNADEDALTAKIEQEGSKSPADVFYTENSPWLEQLDQKHLLAKVDAATLATVPTQDSSADGNWVGVSARVSALVYNTDKVAAADVPTSVMQLADPKWKGKIEIAPTETDFWPIVSSVARTYGRDKAIAWLKSIKANAGAADNVPDNETLTSDTSTGITDMSLINSYYYYRLQSEVGAGSVHAKLAYFAPHDPGFVENISGAGVLASSKHQAAAQKFVAFLTSKAGQTVLATSKSFEYPLATGVSANAELPPLNTLQPNDFTVAELGTGDDAKTLLQQAQLI